jgi:hypothetical protein
MALGLKRIQRLRELGLGSSTRAGGSGGGGDPPSATAGQSIGLLLILTKAS